MRKILFLISFLFAIPCAAQVNVSGSQIQIGGGGCQANNCVQTDPGAGVTQSIVQQPNTDFDVRDSAANDSMTFYLPTTPNTGGYFNSVFVNGTTFKTNPSAAIIVGAGSSTGFNGPMGASIQTWPEGANAPAGTSNYGDGVFVNSEFINEDYLQNQAIHLYSYNGGFININAASSATTPANGINLFGNVAFNVPAPGASPQNYYNATHTMTWAEYGGGVLHQVDATTAAFTLTLPPAAGPGNNATAEVIFWKSDATANAVTIAPAAGDTIAGAGANPQLTTLGATLELIADGTHTWYEVGNGSSGGGGGSVGPGTVNYIPLFNTTTTIGNSHLDDGATTAGTVTSTEPVKVGTGSTPTACNGAAGGCIALTEGTTTVIPAPGVDTLRADSASHCIKASLNGGSEVCIGTGGTGTVVDGAGTTTANQIAVSTATSHQINYTTSIPNGTTATTQTAGDNSTKVATDAFVLANAGSAASVPYVGGATYRPLNGSATLTSIISSTTLTVAPGDVVGVICRSGGTPTAIVVTDSVGSTWNALPLEIGGGSAAQMSWSKVASTGTDSFTCTPSVPEPYQMMVVVDLKGTLGTLNTSASYANASGTPFGYASAVSTTGRTAILSCNAASNSSPYPFVSSYINGYPAIYVENDQGNIVGGAEAACTLLISPQSWQNISAQYTFVSGSQGANGGSIAAFNY